MPATTLTVFTMLLGLSPSRATYVSCIRDMLTHFEYDPPLLKADRLRNGGFGSGIQTSRLMPSTAEFLPITAIMMRESVDVSDCPKRNAPSCV